MTINEIYFKTAFCCMTCDREIASDEILLLKQIALESDCFNGINIEVTAKKYLSQLNEYGSAFLSVFINELEDYYFTCEEQLNIIDIAIRTIEADNKILYEEMSFFKRLRDKLAITDSEIFASYPNKPELADYLLPDIIPDVEENWSFQFGDIDFSMLSYSFHCKNESVNEDTNIEER